MHFYSPDGFENVKPVKWVTATLYLTGWSKYATALIHRQTFISWTEKECVDSVDLIYIYAFSRRFYPKRLTEHSGYTFVLSVYVFPGNRTHNLCAANAMLYHWATQEHEDPWLLPVMSFQTITPPFIYFWWNPRDLRPSIDSNTMFPDPETE